MKLATTGLLAMLELLQLSLLLPGLGFAAPSNQTHSSLASFQRRELPCSAPGSPNPCEDTVYPCGIRDLDSDSQTKLEEQDLATFVASERYAFQQCKSTPKCQNITKFVGDYLRTTYSAMLSKGEMECSADLKCSVSNSIRISQPLHMS